MKSVAFSEHKYSDEIREKDAPQKQGQRPDLVRNPPQYADAIIAIDIDTNDWNSEVQKYQAQGNAVVGLVQKINVVISSRLEGLENVYRSLNSAALLSDLIKVREAQAGGTNYQMWQVPQKVVDKARKEIDTRR
ncbi:hypothetical protein AGMMS50268_00900 [Spirochaetia bacterium]|nr:hypothetical protein AGMMS50268_00900 [Spirochaetia bacterium]